jgi:hypothetical protein
MGYKISGYDSNKLSSITMFNECKLCSKKHLFQVFHVCSVSINNVLILICEESKKGDDL